jgi:hypothetical protein
MKLIEPLVETLGATMEYVKLPATRPSLCTFERLM